MTAKELIEKLSELDPDTRIFTHGYEGGYCDAEPGSIQTFVLNENSSWCYGPHNTIEDNEKAPEGKQVVKGMCL